MRRNSHLRAILGTLIGLLLAGPGPGCGDGGSGKDQQDGKIPSDIPADAYEQAHNFVEQYLPAYCTYLSRCGTKSLTDTWVSGATVDECVQALRNQRWNRRELDMARAIAEKTLYINESFLSECVADLTTGPCRSPIYYDSPCRLATTGMKGVGQPCRLGMECESGICMTNAGEPCGRCQDLFGDVGDPCDSDVDCELGLVCDKPDTSSYGTCQWPPGGGQDCDISCAAGYYCGPGHYCIPKGQQGESCEYNFQCLEGLFCRNGTCQPPTVVSTRGATCDPEIGLGCDFHAGLVCWDGVCKTIPGLGNTCSYQNYPPCDPLTNTFCSVETLTCEPKKAPGEPCEDDSECDAGYCIEDPDTGTGTCSREDVCPAE